MIPRPELLSDLAGSFELASGATVSGDLVDAVRLALPLLDLRPGDAGEIDVRRDPALGEEAYRLTVGSRGVEIVAGGRAGAFYAAQSLHQLLPAASYRFSTGASWPVPGVRIEDAPRFAWRGLHLDVARHFFPKREIFRLLDLMATHKLNRLHLHLVDDQGWRVESRAYPLLHEVSSHRPRTATNFWREPDTYDDLPHGGYYTLDDLAEIGAYARARCVTVVPEIDVPGHASAILAAYPSLGATGERYDVLDRWGISSAILSPLPPTVEFLTTIFDELIGALGETPYVHIGGDEVVLDHWSESAEIVAYRDSLGLAGSNDLQAWFLRRLADALAERGARAVVWDEAFVSGGLREDTVVMPWRGMGVGRRAAAAGHDVVATRCSRSTSTTRRRPRRRSPWPSATPSPSPTWPRSTPRRPPGRRRNAPGSWESRRSSGPSACPTPARSTTACGRGRARWRRSGGRAPPTASRAGWRSTWGGWTRSGWSTARRRGRTRGSGGARTGRAWCASPR